MQGYGLPMRPPMRPSIRKAPPKAKKVNIKGMQCPKCGCVMKPK